MDEKREANHPIRMMTRIIGGARLASEPAESGRSNSQEALNASGWNKTAWLIFLVFVPFLGVFAYVIANGDEMAGRKAGTVGA